MGRPRRQLTPEPADLRAADAATGRNAPWRRPRPRLRLGRATARARPALVRRMLLGETAWLDGRPVWHEGRVAWETGGIITAPTAARLALAERRLKQLAALLREGGPAAADSRLHTRRREQLALAKGFACLPAADLARLAVRERATDQRDRDLLVALLAAEAHCHAPLPALPSVALLAYGGHAIAPLVSLCRDPAATRPTRALAGLTLGALHRQGDEFGHSPPAFDLKALDPWARRAYCRGRRSPFPAEPALAVACLADADGVALTARVEAALAEAGPFRPPVADLRDLLAADMPATRVVALAEALAALAPLGARIADYRADLPARGEERPQRRERREAAANLRRQRAELIAALARRVHAYARAEGDPAAPGLIAEFAARMLAPGLPLQAAIEAAVAAPGDGLTLATPLQRPFLELLVAEHDRLWPRDDPRARSTGRAVVAGWLDPCRGVLVGGLVALLRRTDDPSLVREALALGILPSLAGETWDEPTLYGWAFNALRAICGEGQMMPPGWQLYPFFAALGRCGSVREAEATFGQALALLAGAPHGHRVLLLHDLFDAAGEEREPARRVFARLARHLPALLGAARLTDDPGLVGDLVPGTLALDRANADGTASLLAWTLDELRALRAARTPPAGEDRLDIPGEWRARLALRAAMPLAVALSAGDGDAYRAIFRAVAPLDFARDYDRVERGVAALAAVPRLRGLLARLFPLRPQECVAIVARLGLASRLSPGALDRLEVPEGRAEVAVPAEWEALLTIVPDARAVATRYVAARRLLGTDEAIPGGVRRALALPRKLVGELGYIERLLAEGPARADLRARADALRARLADEERLTAALRAEVGERLAGAAAAAELAAAEWLTLEPYRARLRGLAGPGAVAPPCDEGWLNAAILGSTADRNRRLLRHLLRAHLAGDTGWRERQPANAAFLRGLAARGGDPAAWLSPLPRVYPCPGAAGGAIRLALEGDPLRVLQMGTLFGTCLSADAFNAYSAVTNACELNKRVVYATDGAGRIVGRQLLAIGEDGGLLGFHIYVQLGESAANAALRTIFRRYAGLVAGRCGLALADSGRVPLLFAQGWYDDGVVPWDAATPSAGKKTPGRASTRPGERDH